MAITYKNFAATATTSMADVYTCPSGTTAIVLLLQVSSINTSVAADVTVVYSDASNSNTEHELIKNLTITPQTGVDLPSKLVLEAGDKIRVQASAGSSIKIIGSVSEQN